MKTWKRRDELEASEGRDIARLAREGAGSTLFTAMVVAGIVLIVLLSTRFNILTDVSRGGANVLAPETVDALSRMDEPVKVYGLYRRQLKVQREELWDLVKKFQREKSDLSFEFVDPIQRPGILRDLNVELAQDETAQGAVVVEQGARRVKFTGREEEKLLNALLEVGTGETWTVGFAVGAGIRDPASTANVGLARFAEALESEFYEVATVPLDAPYPPRLDVLVVAAPRLPLDEAQRDRLAAWLEDGGRLLAMLEPNDRSDLDPVLDRWGLALERRTVVDQRENFNGQREFLRVTDYTTHASVEDFDRNFALGLAAASQVSDYEPGDPLVFHQPLANSSGYSFALDEAGEIVPGPLAVAAASWREDSEEGGVPLTRVVLIGDADLASNAYFAQANNRNFMLNVVAWLARNQEKIVIRRDLLTDQRFRKERVSDLVFYDAAVWGAPFVVMVLGLVVGWRRRGK